MYKTSKFSRFFKFLWSSSHPISKEWDEKLNHLLDEGTVTKTTAYTMEFNNEYVVWIGNHPYASGSLYERKFQSKDDTDVKSRYYSKSTFLPTVKTRIRLEDFVISREYKEYIGLL